jgi:hypothetical protein
MSFLKPTFLLLLLLINWGALAQSKPGKAKRYIIWPMPSQAREINGIAVGPVMTYRYPQRVNGLSVEVIGTGFFPLLMPNATHMEKQANDTIYQQINGLGFSGTGTLNNALQVNGMLLNTFIGLSGKCHGLQVSSMYNFTGDLKGVAISFFNEADTAKGLQIGFINKINRSAGTLQIGLWNINHKRQLPIINW